jgi:hypothetical protein
MVGFMCRVSAWAFIKIKYVEVMINGYAPLRESSFVELAA